jgi:hypothetical protein
MMVVKYKFGVRTEGAIANSKGVNPAFTLNTKENFENPGF